MASRTCIALALMLAAAGASGGILPTASLVKVSFESGALKVEYSVDKPAIVTLDVETNTTGTASGGEWVSIGSGNIRTVSGAGKRVAAGPHTIIWRARKDWPSHRLAPESCRAVVKAWPVSRPPDWMIVDLDATLTIEKADRVTYYASTNDFPYPFPESDLYRSRYIVMRFIPAKGVRWMMGGIDLGDVSTHAKPHQTVLDHDYWMAPFELTIAQVAYAGKGSAANKANFLPHCRVPYTTFRGTTSWPDAPTTGSHIGKLRGVSGLDFDLPSESEWEFAARGGYGDTLFGDGSRMWGYTSEASTNLSHYASWKSGTTYWPEGGAKACVKGGQFRPNGYGLYDMSGNVIEFCLDWWQSDITANHAGEIVTNGSFDGSVGSQSKVVRGGYYASSLESCAPYYRTAYNANNYTDGTGVRVRCPIVLDQE